MLQRYLLDIFCHLNWNLHSRTFHRLCDIIWNDTSTNDTSRCLGIGKRYEKLGLISLAWWRFVSGQALISLVWWRFVAGRAVVTRFGENLPLRQNFEKIGKFYMVYLEFGNIFNLLWPIFYAIGQIFIVINGQTLKK